MTAHRKFLISSGSQSPERFSPEREQREFFLEELRGSEGERGLEPRVMGASSGAWAAGGFEDLAGEEDEAFASW